MFRNYLLVAYRSLFRNKLISFLNIFGLAIGLACSLFIFLWVRNELSYDRFHQHASQLYRVEEDQYYDQGTYHVTVTPFVSGPVWQEEIPEVAYACRMSNTGSLLFKYKEKAFYEDQVLAVDSTFFHLYSFSLVKGSPDQVLHDPNSIVITEEIARKYFGKEDPVGKTLEVNNKDLYQVSGVVQNVPKNSSITFSILMPFSYMKSSQWYSESWGDNLIFTHVLLKSNADIKTVDKKLTDVVKRHDKTVNTTYTLAPLTGIHLHAYFGFGHSPGAILNVYIFTAIAFFVLIIACINFMNLTTAQSATRAKEIGLRKVNGARRKDLIVQFFSESLMMSFTALLFALILVLLLIEPFNHISGKSFTYTDLLDPWFIGGALSITVCTGLVSGFYPSLVLSGFKPVNIFRGKLRSGANGEWFRKGTVILQFTLSIILIIASITFYKQLEYLRSRSLGYNKENLIYIPMRGEIRKSYQTIKQELLKDPAVEDVTASIHPPYLIGSNSGGAEWEGKNPDMQTLISMSGVDYDYVETMGIQMKEGRSYSHDFPGDAVHDTTASYLINEEFARLIGKQNVVGMRLRFMGCSGPIIGVMKNYLFQPSRNKIEPLAVILFPADYFQFIIIRMKAGNLTRRINQIQKVWENVMPDYPFDYRFVDQSLDEQFRTESKMGSLMNYFTVLAILIACIGLFGLATFTAIRKTKEIGIRKALGAPVYEIIRLFSGEFAYLLLFSVLIACPVAWMILNKLLQNYDYRIHLVWWFFLFAALLSLVVAMAAILYQAVKAARTNPAITLKYE